MRLKRGGGGLSPVAISFPSAPGQQAWRRDGRRGAGTAGLENSEYVNNSELKAGILNLPAGMMSIVIGIFNTYIDYYAI
jgi:hypothetical protein